MEEVRKFCKGKSVIIVGNSGGLLKYMNGNIIDSYDVVVRLNHGVPTITNKIFIGMKTTIWVFQYTSVDTQLKEYKLLKPKFAIKFVEDDWIHPQLKKKVKVCELEAINDYKLDNKNPTTGFSTIVFLKDYIKTYKKLAIIGFDFFKTTNNFYEIGRSKSKATFINHRPVLEEKYVNEFIKKGDLELL